MCVLAASLRRIANAGIVSLVVRVPPDHNHKSAGREGLMEWTQVVPVYPVADVAAAIDWYFRVFGFEPRLVNPPGDPVPVYAVLRRDGVSLHLLRRDEAPHGLTAPVQAQFWIRSDVDEMFRRAETLEAKVLQRPDDRPWGHRDFMVADPDGNVVWVTMPLKSEAGPD
jgi:uncharacterized glyoxalase superfamily protein PhnB